MDKLPAELFENIMGRVQGKYVASARLVCRAFENATRAAFIELLEQYEFRLRSTNDMKRLENLSQSRVAPLIRFLTFGLDHLPPQLLRDRNPLCDRAGDPDMERVLKWRRFVDQDPITFPVVWDCAASDYANGQGDDEANQRVVEFLTPILENFSGLQSLYYEPSTIEPIWYDEMIRIFTENDPVPVPDPDSWRDVTFFRGESLRADRVAVDIILKTLAKINRSMKAYDLPVPGVSYHAMFRTMPVEQLQQVFSNTVTLYLTPILLDDDGIDPWINPDIFNPDIFDLSATNFPNLQHLTLSASKISQALDVFHSPLVDFPPLTHLTLKDFGYRTLKLQDRFDDIFLGSQKTLKTLTIENCETVDWSGLLRWLQDEGVCLYRLSIISDYPWVFDVALHKIRRVEFYRVAKEVVLSPPPYNDRIQRQWAREQG